MKQIYTLIIVVLLFCAPANAQKRVVDAETQSPIAAASIFDAVGNMVGFTWSDGVFSEVPETAYPITLRCMGYEPLVIDRPEEKTWEMTPKIYELEEVVAVPVKRNILKQTFYMREYFSVCNASDTVTFFMEHMAHRFIPTSKDVKFDEDSSLRILETRQYAHYQVSGKDSVVANPEEAFPISFNALFLNDEVVTAPESFKKSGNTVKHYEEAGKSGLTLIQKQNAQTFTTITDVLADRKGHKFSPWILKALGFSMEFNQLYTTQTYRANEEGIYPPQDLMEASSVMKALGKGKFLRKALKSEKPVIIRSMTEMYRVEHEYLTKEEALEACKNKPTDVQFVIPSTVPALNEATQRLVERANAEAK